MMATTERKYNLLPHHIQHLAESGITPEVASQNGIYSETSVVKIAIGMAWKQSLAKKLGPCLMFPVRRLDGSIAYTRLWVNQRRVGIDRRLDPGANPAMLGRYRFTLAHEAGHCRQCQNLMSHSDFQLAVKDEDDFECTGCGRPFHRHTPVTTVYRLSAETLARPKPAVKTDDVESALRHLDGHPHVFQRMGQIWVLKYEGKMVLMEDARGMIYLARLLVDPGRVVPAAALLASVAGIDPRIATGSSGRLLDDEAFASYRTQYRELQEDIEEARLMNDHGRIAKLESDQEAFEIEIAKATGLGGKKREKTDADRVRRNVSMAVTRAIDSIRGPNKGDGGQFRWRAAVWGLTEGTQRGGRQHG
jgi:hypothetical protein